MKTTSTVIHVSAFGSLALNIYSFFFFFNDTATTEIYTLSLHDALPIYKINPTEAISCVDRSPHAPGVDSLSADDFKRSEEHTSELQSHSDLVCRLLLEKKNNAEHLADSQPTPMARSDGTKRIGRHDCLE